MAMVVRSNLMAYNANRQLGMNNSAVSKNLEKLSSGFKINRAADDAAGLAVSEKMKAQIKGLEQASLNSQDGISLVQTAEGALTEVHDMLNRMTELATKSANGTIQNEVDREAIQNEVNKLNDEIDRIADSTNFNGIKLLNGELSGGGKATAAAATNVKLTDIAAKKGEYDSDGAAIGAIAAGKQASFTVSLDNGKSYSVTFTVSADTKKLIAADGTEYGAGGGASATQAELNGAILDELKKTDLANDFDIAAGATTNGVKLTAKKEGASTPKVTSFGWVDTAGATQTQKVTATTTAADAFQTVQNTAFTAYDGSTNADKAVFEVNGKKFAFVASGKTPDGLDKDVTYITCAGAAPANADLKLMVERINQATGLKTYVADAAGDPDAAGTYIALVGAAGAAGGAGGGLTLQIGDTGEDFNQVTVSVDNMKSDGIGTKGLDVSTQETAKAAIQTIKDGINKVSTNRSELGALQNRLEHTINNLDVTAENMTNANSRIRDTDMAKQMMEYTKMNVLTQSAQAMLAQANQNPQSILQLLQ